MEPSEVEQAIRRGLVREVRLVGPVGDVKLAIQVSRAPWQWGPMPDWSGDPVSAPVRWRARVQLYFKGEWSRDGSSATWAELGVAREAVRLVDGIEDALQGDRTLGGEVRHAWRSKADSEQPVRLSTPRDAPDGYPFAVELHLVVEG